MDEILSRDEVLQSLGQLSGWELDKDEIEKKFEFVDFKQALGFVNKVGELAEAANHHPKIKINYNKVKLKLSTHSVGGVTQADINLAKQIQENKK